MTISIDWATKIINISRDYMTLVQSSPFEVRSLDMDNFRSALKDLEDSEEGMSFPSTHNHVTPMSVGGVTLARVVELINGYTVTFEDGQYAVNLLGANTNLSDNVNLNQVSIRSANSAGLIQQSELDSLKFQVEALRPSHQGFGQPFYVSTTGTDTNVGSTPDSPKLTISSAISSCISGRGDVIYLLTPGVGSATFVENVVINKEDVHIRGPGRGVTIQPTTGYGVHITKDNCSLSGVIVRAASVTPTDCIVLQSKFSKLENLYVIGADTGQVSPTTSEVGIHVKGGDYHKAINVEVEKCGSDGFRFTDSPLASEGSPREMKIEHCTVYYNRGSGIKYTGTSSNSTRLNIVTNSNIQHNSEYGIYIGENTQRTMVMATNYIKDNGTYPTGDVNDANEVFIHPSASDPMVDTRMSTVVSAMKESIITDVRTLTFSKFIGLN